jgi:hypothetical protein
VAGQYHKATHPYPKLSHYADICTVGISVAIRVNDRRRDIVPVERLHARKATVIGVGAIGRQVDLQLTVIGIRWLRIVDFDGGAG